jgi:anti-sigma regulatory factor (Ser/Thr protein kinase)
MTVAGAGAGARFAHEALIYDTDEEYVAALVPFLREGLATGGVVVAVVPQRNAALLRQALGDDRDRVGFIDADSWYRRPSNTIAKYDAVLRGIAEGTRAWVVGEVRFGDSDREWAEWTRYEAALNRALEHHDAHVICPYDIRLLPSHVVEDARCTHHHVLGAAGRSERNDIEPESVVARLALAVQLPVNPPDAGVHIALDASPREARAALALAAAATGFSPDRTDELMLALNEVVTNAICHGEGAVRLQIWATSPHQLTCAVHDHGRGVSDPLVGLCPPRHGSRASGLWLVRQLFDQVEMIQHPGGGLTVLLTATG